MGAASRHGVHLEWVVHQGVDTHVSTFTAAKPGTRPVVLCPQCSEPLVLRLGTVRAWHAAHKPGALCSLTNPESALHFNTKMKLAGILRERSELFVIDSCAGHPKHGRASDCTGHQTRIWLAAWTSVDVERMVQTRRPDIVLLKGGQVIGAIEVWVSHTVEPEKQACFAEWEMPWVEVKAQDAALQRWTGDSPLPFARVTPTRRFVCEACEKEAVLIRDREERDRQEASRRLAEIKASRASFLAAAVDLNRRTSQNGVRFERIRPFHLHLHGGEVRRDALVLADVLREGARVESFVGVASDLTIIQRLPGHLDSLGYQDLRASAEARLDAYRRSGTVVDLNPDWFPLPQTLRDQEFLEDWSQIGWSRTPATAPPPWQVPWAHAGPDWLYLLRSFMERYLQGLPLRYRWSEKQQRWFQTAILRETPWRLWPEIPPPRNPLPLPRR